jgi:hypothetical protein
MTKEELKIRLQELYNVQSEFQKMTHSSNSSYVNNVAALLKETNINTFIKNSETINSLYNQLQNQIESALLDVKAEIELIKSKLEG